ncbi:hypothetical protein INS49_008375 [Diaporthe citri]|uniref:uncharacterized protein n=1 Tax=Diaporthe citri TaxID=83186 RepID=UPI001C800C4D|nr:uncharacterized protein INS49_008375 [Diaporthe citri]KAG6363278.1 hypothetical protein INS49_008375 [Diaporthe citri]
MNRFAPRQNESSADGQTERSLMIYGGTVASTCFQISTPQTTASSKPASTKRATTEAEPRRYGRPPPPPPQHTVGLLSVQCLLWGLEDEEDNDDGDAGRWMRKPSDDFSHTLSKMDRIRRAYRNPVPYTPLS